MHKRLRGIITITLVLPLFLPWLGCEDSYIGKKLRGDDEKAATPQKDVEKTSAPAPAVTLTKPVAKQETNPETKPTEAQSSGTGSPGKPSTPVQTPFEKFKGDFNILTACLNRAAPRVAQSKQRYLSWVNEAKGPNCQERHIVYALYTLYPDAIQKCQKQFIRP